MDLKTIEILWMDGEQQVYDGVTTSVHEGVLHIHQYTSVTHMLTGEWHFPTANIRMWGPSPYTVT